MAAAQVDNFKEHAVSTDSIKRRVKDLQLIVDNVIKKVDSSFCVKSKQMEAITNVISGYDTLAILPTSYGKSMIYQMLPQIFYELGEHENPTVLVVSPLKSLINDQIIEANELQSSLGIKACSLDSDDLNVEKIKSENYNIIFGIPELWLTTLVKELLSSKIFQRNVVCVVVDEAHKVAW